MFLSFLVCKTSYILLWYSSPILVTVQNRIGFFYPTTTSCLKLSFPKCHSSFQRPTFLECSHSFFNFLFNEDPILGSENPAGNSPGRGGYVFMEKVPAFPGRLYLQGNGSFDTICSRGNSWYLKSTDAALDIKDKADLVPSKLKWRSNGKNLQVATTHGYTPTKHSVNN